MKFHYYPETDSLYIELSEKPSTDSHEIAPNIVVDFGTDEQPVGIDIQHASQLVDLTRLKATSLPLEVLSVAK